MGDPRPGYPAGVAAPSRTWSLRATPQNVAIARHVVAAYARWHRAADPLNIALAVSEAFTNAVIHAYPEPRPVAYVEVVAERLPRQLEIRVADHGRGIVHDGHRPDGMGISMMRQLADRVEIGPCRGGGTVVVMSFPLA